ncbi:hypothetical protein KUCAC02_007043 [Chaenocephalus aceratus]|nr:hypothetical protein KUCAC02_007043 [Chaenocephalus aceratus]
MDKRKRLMNVQEALALLNRLSEAESDGSSDSDPEPPRNVRPSHPDPPLADGPTVPAHAEVCATEPSPAQEIGKDGTGWTVWRLAEAQGEGADTEHTLTESAGPTPHARHNTLLTSSQPLCVCCDSVMNVLNEDRATWDVSIMELKAFIALLYVRGAILWEEHRDGEVSGPSSGARVLQRNTVEEQVSGNHALPCALIQGDPPVAG